MSEDIDPERAAQHAVRELDDGDTSGGGGRASFPGVGGDDGPMARLFDGDAPGPTVPEIQRDYNFPQWLALVTRGGIRAATGDGIPPVVEIVGGGVLGVRKHQSQSESEESESDEEVEEDDPAIGGSGR